MKATFMSRIKQEKNKTKINSQKLGFVCFAMTCMPEQFFKQEYVIFIVCVHV